MLCIGVEIKVIAFFLLVNPYARHLVIVYTYADVAIFRSGIDGIYVQIEVAIDADILIFKHGNDMPGNTCGDAYKSAPEEAQRVLDCRWSCDVSVKIHIIKI